MSFEKSAAASHVGKIRSNNQDSGYAGKHLFVVADGMGGHAGGDVASAIAVRHIAEVDRGYPNAADAEFSLRQSLLAANGLLAETVFEHNELTGMGTTVSAIMLVGDSVAIAHIGDSRIYLHRDGEMTQITADHTFVQRLVDSGRITAEEAAVHPRRSVLMRVLGDVDANPDIDTAVMGTLPGDRWLLCSDGLSSYVSEDKIAAALGGIRGPEQAVNRLIKDALDAGAPDNVTAVLVDIDGSGDSSHTPPLTVGSAAEPLTFENETSRRAIRLPSLLLHPLKATQTDDAHFEPESDEYLDELIREDHRRAIRRRITWLSFLAVIIIGVVVAAILGYNYTQRQYFVGSDDGRVAIFQGVQQDLGPIGLSHVVETTTLLVDELPTFRRDSVNATINANDLEHAQRIVEQLKNARVP